MNYLNRILNNNNISKNQIGTLNELLIAGNMYNRGYKVNVTNDRNPYYDIIISKDDKVQYLECKFDKQANRYGNFYFEYWNYTYSRKTGINSDDLNTLYSHTYYNVKEQEYYHLIGKRKQFIKAIRYINSNHPDKVRNYEHTYRNYNSLSGDAAYIVDIDTFLTYFTGYNLKLVPSFKWY